MTTVSRRTMLFSALGAAASAGTRAERAPAGDLVVSADGTARLGARVFRCALGRGGIKSEKHEGDGATPIGTWPLRRLFYRADRLARPATVLQVRRLKTHDGWCDAPGDAHYNENVTLPYPASAEALWRRDHLYDLIAVVGYNDAPAVSGVGSAIFLHVARANYAPTAGCIAFVKADLLRILAAIDAETKVVVQA